jgi:large subunit ribosomal protein L5
MKTVKEKEQKAYEVLKEKFGYKNKMATPKLVKVVVSSGTGTGIKKDKNRNDFVLDRLSKITGQKPNTRGSKKSVASFKVREGDPIGVTVTLRGARMYGFLDKLLDVSLPRTKDFRGIDRKIVDSVGNATIGMREHTIFPETADEELKDVFGLAITIVTTAKNKEEAIAFFELIGVPFKK